MGDTIYNFSLKDVDGNCIELYDYLGDVILLDSMAAWCSGCQADTDNLQTDFWETYQQYGFVAMQLYAQNRGGGLPSQFSLQNWITTYSITFPLLADPNYGWADPLNDISLIPFYTLVDQSGTIIAKINYYYPDPPNHRPGSLAGFATEVETLLGID